MSIEAQNTKLVQDAYAAFSRGDIQSILATLADDVVWVGVYGAESHVPNSGVRRGKPAVAEFFRQVGETYNFTTFEPRDFIATGDKVVALGHYTAKTTAGPQIDSDFAMVFTIRNGKVTHFQEFTDSSALNKAFAGRTASV
jgi:ketosteroid isomerase-like protein